MRVLALADKPPPMDPALMAEQLGVQASSPSATSTSPGSSRSPAADILICHCPPLGINDDPDDPTHVGFEGLREWVDRHRPRHILHGHTHPIAGRAATRSGDARVHWVSGARELQLD